VSNRTIEPFPEVMDQAESIIDFDRNELSIKSLPKEPFCRNQLGNMENLIREEIEVLENPEESFVSQV
jgi:hypothetical protein